MTAEQISVREQLRGYMARSGMSTREIAEETGYTRSTIAQFISYSHFGTSDRETGETALKLRSWIEANPLPGRQAAGKLYMTSAVREMDRLLAWCRQGGWGILYGPAGAQKTFTLQTRAAECAEDQEPWMALIEVTGAWSAFSFFRALAAELGLRILYNSGDGFRRGLLRSLRRRQTPLAIVIDEADLLYDRIDTLQAIRRFVDLAHGHAGLLVAGNEQIEKLFEPRRKSYMEQWRSRIEQERVRVLGPTRAEAKEMVQAEAPQLSDAKVERLLDGCTVNDAAVTRRDYVNARRLFNTLARGKNAGRTN